MTSLAKATPSKLRIAKYRFDLRLQDPLSLPPYKGSVLRGGFGYAFKRTVCLQRSPQFRRDCNPCPVRSQCPYVYVFQTLPPALDDAPFDASDAPRPFVLEPPLDGRTDYSPGDSLTFNLVLVGRGIHYLPYFIVVFQRLGELGLGRHRAHYELLQVEALPLCWPPGAQEDGAEKAQVVYQNGTLCMARELSAGWDDLLAATADWPHDRVALHFLTPTRLKYHGAYTSHPTFDVLARALLRRVSWLCWAHCGERWEADFGALVRAAEAVRIEDTDTRWVEWERYSTRQQRYMSAGGFVGRASYRGELRDFLPLLLAGSLLHVGKLCVFGHGQYEVER